MMADLSLICARCGHSPEDHEIGCCSHYGVPGPGRVDPVCFCQEFVAYSEERIARWNAEREAQEPAEFRRVS